MRKEWFVRITATLLLVCGSHALAREVCKLYAEPGELFRLLPGPGSGSPATLGFPYSDANFCSSDVFNDAKTGATNGFCWEGDGDGTVWKSSASYELSAVGSPTTVTRRVCPNGPDCGNMTAQRLSGTSQYFKTSNVTGLTGDFSLVWFGRADDLSANALGLAKYDNGSANPSVYLSPAQSTGAVSFAVYKNTVSSSAVTSAGSLVVPGGLSVVVGTYDFVADGSSVMNIYVDGVLRGTNTTAVGPPNSTTQPIAIGARSDGSASNMLKGNVHAAAVLDGVVLTQAQVTSIYNALIPPLRGTRGEVITTSATVSGTGAAGRTCTAPNGDISALPNNRPCVTCPLGNKSGCGLLTEPSVAAALFQSESLGTTWTLGTGATQTPDGADFGPGTTTMDLLDNTGSANFTSITTQPVAVTSSTGPFVTSAYVRPQTTSSVVSVGLTCNASVLTTACSCYTSDGTACTASVSGADRCYATATVTGLTRLVLATTCASARTNVIPWVYAGQYTVTRDAAYFGGMMLERNNTVYATTYVPTTTAAVTRSGVSYLTPTPARLSRTKGCARVTVTPIWTGANPITSNIYPGPLGNNTATARFFGGSNNATHILIYDGTSSATLEPAGYVAHTPSTFKSTWDAASNVKRMTRLDTGASISNTFATLGEFDANISIGSRYGTDGHPIGALLSNIELGDSADGCTR